MRMLLLLLLLLPPLLAEAQPRPEEAILYRQSAYKMILWNFAPMGSMVRGATPFDAAEFARRAERVAQLSAMPLEGFTADSGPDQEIPTDALAAVWQNWEDFSERMRSFQTEAQRLAEVAKAGDREAIDQQFAATAGTCRGCHDNYRAK